MDYMDLGYYLALLLIPFVVYILYFENNTYGRNKKGWLYFVKLYFATAEIKNYQKKCSRKFKLLGNKLESKLEFPSNKSTHSQYIYGSDQHNNSLSLKFTLRSTKKAEVSLCLRLQNGNIYTLPGAQNINIYSVVGDNWQVKGLNIEILEPFKRLRITFNGLLKKITAGTKENIVHVQFNFIWNTSCSPKYFPQDADTKMLAESIAGEIWRDKDWAHLLSDLSKSYEQFGALQGFITGEDFPNKLTLNLPCTRSRCFGPDVRLTLNRELRIFLAVDDGTLINLVISSLRNGCSQVNSGNVILSTGNISSICKTDIILEHVGHHKNIPELLTVHVKASDRIFKCVFYLNKTKQITMINNESRGCEYFNIPVDCDVNARQGKAIIEFWYKRNGDGVELPPPLLLATKSTVLPSNYVVNIQSEEARIVELTGGKGNSLALLASLNSNDFSVPDGFILTVNAFRKQIIAYQELKDAISVLEHVWHEGFKDKLKEACNSCVEAFKSKEITADIVDATMKELKFVEATTKFEDIPKYSWAIRSSAVGEDSEELSAAGQNETFLGCVTERDILKSISACWASLFSFQSVQYRWRHGLSIRADMAVVVQLMIPADSAGVLFTCHPTTSNPSQMVVTANFGLGESVVSGKSEPDTFIVNATVNGEMTILEHNIGDKNKIIRMTDNGVQEVDTEKEFVETLSITKDEVLTVAKVGFALDNAYGSARDIEWAFYKKRLYLLQSRPVTTMNMWSDFELLHEFDVPILTEDNVFTVANTGEVCPGALTILSQTVILASIDASYQKLIGRSFEPLVLCCLPTIQHHVMINVINSIHHLVQEDIKVSSKIVDLALFGHPIINEKINSISLNRFGKATPKIQLKELLKAINAARKNGKIVKKIVEMSKIEVDLKENDSIGEMYRKIDQATIQYYDIWSCHTTVSQTSVFYQVIAMTLLVERDTDLTVDHCADFALILSSCEDVISAEIPLMLSKISTIIQEDGKSDEFCKLKPENGVQWLQTNCTAAHWNFKEFLKEHGHRLLDEFNLMEDSWSMDPTKVIVMLQANCRNKTKLKKTIQTVNTVMSKLVSPKSRITKMILNFLITKMRVAVGNREKTKSEAVRSANKIRIAYRQLADKMVLEGILPEKNLIYHLSHSEVAQIISKRSPLLIRKAMQRQRLYSSWNVLRFPEIMYGVPETEKQEEYVQGTGEVMCSGTPVCSGTVTARACVIINLENIDQLKPGDILITYSTDIGWSPYFPMLSGIVTELGGLISHGAVIAREYGLPCVVGVRGATKMFKTGDTVLLTGQKGTIELIS